MEASKPKPAVGMCQKQYQTKLEHQSGSGPRQNDITRRVTAVVTKISQTKCLGSTGLKSAEVRLCCQNSCDVRLTHYFHENGCMGLSYVAPPPSSYNPLKKPKFGQLNTKFQKEQFCSLLESTVVKSCQLYNFVFWNFL